VGGFAWGEEAFDQTWQEDKPIFSQSAVLLVTGAKNVKASIRKRLKVVDLHIFQQ